MATTHYERLSALDAHFLELETEGVHMHVAALLVCDAAPLTRNDGGLDVDRISAFLASRLHQIPRYRQRLAWIPLEHHPVWVDDPGFDIHYHVRHVSLPRPGDERQLKRLVGLISSQKFDVGKPLWEMWLIEGIEGNRCAVLARSHHSMVDGIAGVGVLRALLQAAPSDVIEAAPPWRPRPVPSDARLAADSLLRRASEPFALVDAARRALADPSRALRGARDAARGLGESLGALRAASPTPINPEHIGGHRRVDWLRLDLDEVKQVGRRLGGTVNDVVLATVAGAMRRYLHAHRVALRDIQFRVMCPLNVRADGAAGTAGNRVVMLVVELPLDERDPRKRLARVVATTTALKESRIAQGSQLIEEIGDWTTTSVVTETIRLATRLRVFNMVVTNVPGPQLPLYLMNAPVVATYPLVPLYENQALGIALLSYAGGLFVGLSADWDRVGDLHDATRALADAFDELRKTAAD